MKRYYSPRPNGKFTVSYKSLMAVLVLAALFQIALCLGASLGMLQKPTAPLRSTVQLTGSETNAPLVRDVNSATNGKSSGFQSDTTHG